jgi:hypothetical protein
MMRLRCCRWPLCSWRWLVRLSPMRPHWCRWRPCWRQLPWHLRRWPLPLGPVQWIQRRWPRRCSRWLPRLLRLRLPVRRRWSCPHRSRCRWRPKRYPWRCLFLYSSRRWSMATAPVLPGKLPPAWKTPCCRYACPARLRFPRRQPRCPEARCRRCGKTYSFFT